MISSLTILTKTFFICSTFCCQFSLEKMAVMCYKGSLTCVVMDDICCLYSSEIVEHFVQWIVINNCLLLVITANNITEENFMYQAK